jgi:hypothetical protein
MIKNIVYEVYSDPDHAWCKVPMQKLVDLGIQDKISKHSYKNGEDIYLEQDYDLPLFIEHLKQTGIDFQYKVFTTKKSSRIRNYQSYKGDCNGNS